MHINRRSMLKGLSSVSAALGATAGIGSISAYAKQDHQVPVPEVEGPVTGGVRTGEPMAATVANISNYGYIEEEYFVSGIARPLVSDSDETATYKTRILVYRPTDQDKFNGTLTVNWPNVTEQTDVPFSFANKFDYAMREGYALAIASVQKQGTDGSPLALRNWDPERYSDITHPGDEYAYDMFSQVIQALRHRPRPEPDPLRGLYVRNTIAMGISQSASRLHTYLDEVQADHSLVDGFIPESIGAPETEGEIRDDLVPILWVNTETEVRNFGLSGTSDPRDDGGLFKLWEVAGATHTNNYSMTYRDEIKKRDHGNVDSTGTEAEWNPEEMRQYGEQGGSDCPYNLFPHQYAHRAALHQMNKWITQNEEAPSAPRIERDGDEPKEDKFGSAVGGLRSPVIDVPVAMYESSDCIPMRGRTEQFDEETLHELYPTHDDYVAKMQSTVNDAVERGWLVESDAEHLMRRCRASSIPETNSSTL